MRTYILARNPTKCYKRKRKRTKKGRSLERMTTAHTLALNEERKRDRSAWKHAGTTPSLESLIGVQSRRLRERVNIRDPVCGSRGICGSIYVTKTLKKVQRARTAAAVLAFPALFFSSFCHVCHIRLRLHYYTGEHYTTHETIILYRTHPFRAPGLLKRNLSFHLHFSAFSFTSIECFGDARSRG